MSNEYNVEMQKLFLEFLMADHELFVRCNGIMDPDFFDRMLRPSARFVQEYVADYGQLPSLHQLSAKTSVELQDITPQIKHDEVHKKWFLTEFETFCRYKALEQAIIISTDHLEKKEYGIVEKLIKDAVAVGIAKEFGINYWDNTVERLERTRASKGGTSTGWLTFDRFLYGGFNPGELNIFAGGSGSGKSLFMQNLGLNWSLAGKNVVYVTLELSEDLCAMRLDSMNTGMSTRDLFKNINEVGLKLGTTSKTNHVGKYQIVQLPNGCTVNDIRAYLKEYQIQHDLKVDALLIDYLDLMSPTNKKISLSDQFIKDKYVSEELRNLATELNVLFVTASQLNRGSVDEVDFDHSHIAGGISKINTADNVIGIFTSKAMKERGQVQIQFMKTRSSSGVGMKLDLAFDVNSLRISDLDEDARDSTENNTASLYDKLKRGSTTQTNKISTLGTAEKAVDNTDRLRSILKRSE